MKKKAAKKTAAKKATAKRRGKDPVTLEELGTLLGQMTYLCDQLGDKLGKLEEQGVKEIETQGMPSAEAGRDGLRKILQTLRNQLGEY